MKGKKHNTRQILLSVTALLVIALLAAGITYSWIEGGQTFTLSNGNNNVQTGTVPTSNEVHKSVELDPDSNNGTIDLTKYDANTNNSSANSQSLYFAEISSNGESFFLPDSLDDGNPVTYREATTNDIGTKFISYSFTAAATKKCGLTFSLDPTFIATNTSVDTTAFRIMIKCENEKTILWTGTDTTTDTVVTSIDSSGNPAKTEEVTVYPVSNYKDADNALVNFAKDEEKKIEISVWLDGTSASSDLLGQEVKFEMNLNVAAQNINVTYNAVTYNNTSETDNTKVLATNGFAGGSITVNGTEYWESYTDSKASGSTFSATAAANSNYTFEGWYSDEACTESVSAAEALSETLTEDTTYYAKFVEKDRFTVAASAVTVGPDSAEGGTVAVTSSTGTVSGTTVNDYTGSTATLTAKAYDGYRFAGWYSDSSCSTSVTTQNPYTVTISANTTYYAKFIKTCDITVTIRTDETVDAAGGSVSINTTTNGTVSSSDATTVENTADYGTTVTLTVSANSNYKFSKWVDASVNQAETFVNSATNTYTFTIYDDVNCYADFVTDEQITTTIYIDQTLLSGNVKYIYVYDSDGTEWTGSWHGENLTDATDETYTALDGTKYYVYTFKVSKSDYDGGTFYAIVNDGSNSQLPASGADDATKALYSGTYGGTYHFTEGGIESNFDPDDVTSVTTTVYIPVSGSDSYSYIYTYSSVNSSTVEYTGAWASSAAYDKTVTYTINNAKYYKYSFVTYDNEGTAFYAMINDRGDSKYPDSTGLKGYLGGTYLFSLSASADSEMTSINDGVEATLPTESLLSNTLVFNYTSSSTVAKSIWYWTTGNNGSYKTLTTHTSSASSSKTISIYATSDSQPNAIAFSQSHSGSTWSSDGKITGDIVYSSS
ncbi:MAG: InlB B-repeat-containing protein [Clostridiales bacterium]|nr:InlB B-repeat-containing protein [Clostridiales bacterium]